MSDVTKLVQFTLTKEEAVLLMNAAAAAQMTATLQPVMMLRDPTVDVTEQFMLSWALFFDVRNRMGQENWNALVDKCNRLMVAAFGADDDVRPIDPNPAVDEWRKRRERDA